MKSTPFINYLLQFASLNPQQIELIENSTITKTFHPGEHFSQAGQVSKEIGFINEGIFRVCYYDHDGNEITRYFLEENKFIVDINSFGSGIPSTEYIQAVTPAEVTVLGKEAMEELSSTIILWDSIVGKITAKAMAEKVVRVSYMMPQDATTRYQFFLENFPNLANRIPLQYIASYIGVTKSSLSRLRKNLGKT